jgi:glycosyltransferase involved in cell wall biosynthesis
MIVTLHGSDVLQGRFQRSVSKLVSALADSTIVVSSAIAARCPGTLIPCGVDLERFHPLDRATARLQLGLTAAGNYILFPFNPERRLKRHDIAAEAVALLKKEGLNVSLVSVWSVPNEQMPLYYSAMDAMVLCSDTEGSPTSVKEALACNLPVVSTDVGDVRSLLRGIDGTEICEQRASSIAAGLRRVLDRTAGAVFDGRSAMSRYDQAATVDALLDVYNGVVRRGRRVAAPSSGEGCA